MYCFQIKVFQNGNKVKIECAHTKFGYENSAGSCDHDALRFCFWLRPVMLPLINNYTFCHSNLRKREGRKRKNFDRKQERAVAVSLCLKGCRSFNTAKEDSFHYWSLAEAEGMEFTFPSVLFLVHEVYFRLSCFRYRLTWTVWACASMNPADVCLHFPQGTMNIMALPVGNSKFFIKGSW